MDVLIGQLLVFVLSVVSRVPFTLAVPYSLFIFLVYAPTLPLPFTTGFVIAFIFQAVETLLTISFAVSNAANLDTGPRTVDPCSGREVTSPLATILALESPTTSQPQANQLNQSNEDDLAQVDQITQNYELESGHSLGVKGNLKNNLGFWRSIGAPDFILSIIENGYRQPFISFPLAVKLRNNKSARLHADFEDQAVLELVFLVGCVWLMSSPLL